MNIESEASPEKQKIELSLQPYSTSIDELTKGGNMIEFENSITINRRIDEVFDYTTNPTTIPEWNYYVISVMPTSSDPGTAGATYHQVRKIDEQDFRIVSIKENNSFIIETISPSKPEFRREMIFESDGEITHITDHWWLDLGVPKILGSIASVKAKEGVMQNLNKLKTLLEEGSVTLQDGKVISH